MTYLKVYLLNDRETQDSNYYWYLPTLEFLPKIFLLASTCEKEQGS